MYWTRTLELPVNAVLAFIIVPDNRETSSDAWTGVLRLRVGVLFVRITVANSR